ncbi:hypothetical protein ID866_4380 [Astraeus odoratus]|nr:hypothetical protein ID866_4380 [Astraeus odoratus]
MTPVLAAKALPTDAELEAEAMRERDRSRREAERILTLEAEERRAMEERVLAMMNSSPQSLPPPARGRSQTLPNTPSPSHSAREGGTSWWTAAKNRLTPTKEKEPLTPAQQIIQEVKARDKDKKITKGKQGPTSAPNSGSDLNLKIPSGGPQPRTYSPTSPSPHRTPVRLSPQPATQPPVNLSPISLQRGPSPGGSPAREQPPLYATFTPSGTLDVPGTLLTIAKRFEKLERWTVSHVRALEERMGDVERWLVERESERGKEKEDEERGIHVPESEIGTLKDEVAELQSRIGELGREMARFATSAAAGSNASVAHESRVIYAEGSMINSQETASAIATASVGAAIVNTMTTPRRVPSLTARESTSPPLARVVSHRTGTRLPYPTGDYASPDVISPTHTPASSPPAASRPTSMVISGLPSMSSPLGTPGSMSPPARAMSPTPSGLPAPSIQAIRRGSISPSPLPAGRKRYTVALGGPIVAPPEVESEYEREREKAAMGSAYSMSVAGSSEDDDEDMSETLGKKGAARAMAATKLTSASEVNLRSAPSPGSRARAQSTYGGGSANALQSNQAQTKHRFRSQSTDFRSDAALGSDPQPTKFVDPLILRRQSKSEKAKENKPLVGPGKKVPIGELVAFFDSEKKN